MDHRRRPSEADFRRRTPLFTASASTVQESGTSAIRASTGRNIVWHVLLPRWHFLVACTYFLVRVIQGADNATSLGALVGLFAGFLLVWAVCYGVDALGRLAYAGWRHWRF